MIETFIRVLKKAGLAVSDVQLAESLWLARYLPAPSAKAEVAVLPLPATKTSETEGTTKPSQPSVTAGEPPATADGHRAVATNADQAALYPEIAPRAVPLAARASRIRVPAAVALPGELAIGRAMRPFSRRFPSRHAFVIDEEATVERIADGGPVTPVLRPLGERWFEAALVVEDTPSMVVWHRTANEFAQVLQTVGAFSDVRRWQLALADGQAVLRTTAGSARAPAELNHPSARRLIIVMTDGVSDGWRRGIFPRTLAAWAEITPVVIAQMLPVRLWPRTALGTATATVWSSVPGVPNSALMVKRPWWVEEPLDGRIPVVPFTLDAASILRCAQTVMAAGVNAPALIIGSPAERADATGDLPVPAGDAGIDQTGALPAEERVAGFRTMVSPQAYDLAVFFSAIPLTLPVMRVVQKAMAPGARQEHLAEVFVGGILERVTPASVRCPPDVIDFDFVDGVREVLQGSLRRSEVVDVLSVISRFVDEHFGQALDFGALIADPGGAVALAEGAKPFARIGADLLARVLPAGRLGPSPPGKPKPRLILINLPPPPDPFVGREQEFKQALDALTAPSMGDRLSDWQSLSGVPPAGSGPRIVYLVGLEGIGKWTMARALVHDPAIQKRFPDGIVWLGEDGSGYPREALRAFARETGVPGPFDETGAVDQKLFRELFAQPSVLFVADQRSASEMVPTLVEDAGAHCAIVVLWDREPSVARPTQHVIKIGVDPKGREHLTKYAAVTAYLARSPSRESTPQEAYEDWKIAEFADANPLLIRLLIGGMRREQPAGFSSRAQAEYARTDARAPNERRKALSLVRAMWPSLSAEMRSALQQLVADADRRTLFDKSRLATVWEGPDGILPHLVALGFLDDLGDRVRVHPLVRYAAGQMETGPSDFAVFRDIDAPWCPELVALPAGEFRMGSPDDEEGRFDDEGPQHRVTIGYRFVLGRYPVTFAEYDHFCEATKRETPDDHGWGRGRRPVINVSWRDAQAYVEWLARETGQSYRLPSEAEWEYACRAGTTTRYAFGDEITDKDANFDVNVGRTTEVGAYPPNLWGLYDMHGNVWEWVEDVWHDTYQGAPADGSAWTEGEGKQSSRTRVLRGGSWDLTPWNLRSAFRSRNFPDFRYLNLGFRVARTLD